MNVSSSVRDEIVKRVREGDTSLRVAAADWDPGTWKVSFPDGSYDTFTREEFLAGVPRYGDRFDVLIVENAHLKERNPYSVAQVYERDELPDLYDNMQVPILIGSARLARRYDVFTSNDKSRDAVGMRKYFGSERNQLRCLEVFNPPRTETEAEKQADRMQDMSTLREEIKQELNVLRASWKPVSKAKSDTQVPEIVRCRELLGTVWHIIPDDTKEALRVREATSNRGAVPKGEVIMQDGRTVMMTLYCLAFSRDGRLRRNPSGDFIGVETLMSKIAGMNHRRFPNMIRSQFLHHGFRGYPPFQEAYKKLKASEKKLENAKSNQAKLEAEVKTARAEMLDAKQKYLPVYMKHLKIMLRALREAGLKAENPAHVPSVKIVQPPQP